MQGGHHLRTCTTSTSQGVSYGESSPNGWRISQLWSLVNNLRCIVSGVGASESLQSRFSHHLGSMFFLLGFHLRVLRDWYEFEYRLDHFCHVALVCFFHSMSLVCFLFRAFVFPLLAWHTPSLCCHLLDVLGYVD